ncbi:MAG: CRTAC1 family protein [Acidobacteriota bacterium]
MRRSLSLAAIVASAVVGAAGAQPPDQPTATPSAGASPYFTEVAAEVGLDFVHWNGMTGELYYAEMTGGGGALLDYDRDGDLDLWVVQGQLLNPKKTAGDAAIQPRYPQPLTDRLYRNDTIRNGRKGALRFVDVTDEAGLAARGYGMGATAGDYDGDGWTDVYVTNLGANELWRNRGDGTFENVTEAAGVGDPGWSVPAAFVDADRDGRLDLYVGNYLDFRVSRHKPCFSAGGVQDYCGPSSFEPEADRLYRNLGPDAEGTVRFADITAAAGLGTASGGALGVVTGDYDGDGRIDLYVANDEMANHLWLAAGQTGAVQFEEMALLGGAAVNADGLAEASMGVDAGDVDNDGDEDLFMSHLTAQTNTLYLNDGTGFFEDATAAVGLGLPSFAFTGFGTKLFDVDNDGWLDVLVVNGAVKSVEALVRARDPYPLHQTDQLFLNRGDGRFRDATAEAGPAFDASAVSRGLAVGDLDNDGDLDALIFDNHSRVRLLRNEIGADRSWIGLEPWDTTHDRPALGARVGATIPDVGQRWRRVRVDGGYTSSNDHRVLVGLDDAEAIGTVRVEWPDGSVEIWNGLALGRYHRLEQGRGQAPPTGAGG